MQNAVYGVYRKGQVIFNEPVTTAEDANVIIVFLDNQVNEPATKNNKLINIFNTLGAWEDAKDINELIDEIEKTRVSKTVDIIIWNIYSTPISAYISYGKIKK